MSTVRAILTISLVATTSWEASGCIESKRQDVHVPPGREATELPWPNQFRVQAFSRVVGITPQTPPRLVVSANRVLAGQPRGNGQVWTTDLDGGRSTLLAEERDRVLLQFAPAPSGGRVAYVSSPAGVSEPAEAARQTAVRLADGLGGVVTVADGGAQAPAWATDGNSLLLLRAMGDGWQPHRVVLAGPPNPVQTALVFTQPFYFHRPSGQFSPDGRLVAGGRFDCLVVADLQTGAVREFPELTGVFSQISWSPDGRRLYIQRIKGHRYGSQTFDLVLNLDDGSAIPLNNTLGLLAPPAPDDVVSLLAAAWVPGAGHRLLLLAHTEQSKGDDAPAYRAPGDEIRERRWLVRDLDTKTSTAVYGLPTDPQMPDSAPLSISLDGRHVSGMCTLSVLDAPL